MTARRIYGIHQTRVYSAMVQRVESQVSRTSERGFRDWVHAILKSGTAWKVISVMTPSEPRERSAARKSWILEVELQWTRWPFARTEL
jgi:hypothetical protein